MLHRIYLPQTTTGPKLVFAMHGEDIDHLIREGGMHLPKDPKYEQTSDIFFVFGATPEQVQEQFGLNEKSRSILEGWLREGPAPVPLGRETLVILFHEKHITDLLRAAAYRMNLSAYPEFGVAVDLVFVLRQSKRDLFKALDRIGVKLPS